jgi:hypothetical protein
MSAGKAAQLGLLTAQGEAHMAQTIALNMTQNDQNHKLQMAQTVAQGERHRQNITEKFSNDTSADSMNKAKNAQDSLSQAAST